MVMLPFLFGTFLFAVVLLNKQPAAAALQSSDLTEKDVIDFLTKGHVLLRNILPELRDASFREEYEHAKVEASKAYERFFIEFLECDKASEDSNFLERVESGDGPQALKECIEYKASEDGRKKRRKPFYQIVNLHEYSNKIKDVATGTRFASIVADLLRVERVRLYQSRTFRKVPSQDDTMRVLFNHPTYMHADLSMVPLDTNEYLTFWCPCRNLTEEDSVLTYATGSHRDIAYRNWHNNRDYDDDEVEEDGGGEHEENNNSTDGEVEVDAAATGDAQTDDTSEEIQREAEQIEKEACVVDKEENQDSTGEVEGNNADTDGDAQTEETTSDEIQSEAERIEEEDWDINAEEAQRYNVVWYDDLSVGDCVVHHGWLDHGSTSQVFKNGPRDAITFSYIDGDARKLESKEERHGREFLTRNIKEDQIMFRDWYYDVPEGEVVDHPKLPLVWPPQ
jgi:hypothetical protein